MLLLLTSCDYLYLYKCTHTHPAISIYHLSIYLDMVVHICIHMDIHISVDSHAPIHLHTCVYIYVHIQQACQHTLQLILGSKGTMGRPKDYQDCSQCHLPAQDRVGRSVRPAMKQCLDRSVDGGRLFHSHIA